MAIWEGKKYKLTKSENFDEYMKELGVGFCLRTVSRTASSTVSLSKEVDVYTLLTETTIKNSTIQFKLGEEFQEETLDGRKVGSVITLDGNTLTHRQDGNRSTTIIREFSDKFMIATMTVNGVKCIREYEVVQ